MANHGLTVKTGCAVAAGGRAPPSQSVNPAKRPGAVPVARAAGPAVMGVMRATVTVAAGKAPVVRLAVARAAGPAVMGVMRATVTVGRAPGAHVPAGQRARAPVAPLAARAPQAPAPGGPAPRPWATAGPGAHPRGRWCPRFRAM
jgi:hypothetical protein